MRQSTDDPVDDWGNDEPSNPFNCVDHWQNTGSDQQQKMFSVFNESGIFIACCCLYIVLLCCDMIKSGELYVFNLLGSVSLFTILCTWQSTHW